LNQSSAVFSCARVQLQSAAKAIRAMAELTLVLILGSLLRAVDDPVFSFTLTHSTFYRTDMLAKNLVKAQPTRSSSFALA
jgi:hypothetical protein